MVKFPTPNGVATLNSRPPTILECRRLEERQTEYRPREQKPLEVEVQETNHTEEVWVNPSYPDQPLVIDTGFSKECRWYIIELLRKNEDVFAWQPSDMTGVPRRIIRHNLNVKVSDTPVAQKRRSLSTEKSQVVLKEVAE